VVATSGRVVRIRPGVARREARPTRQMYGGFECLSRHAADVPRQLTEVIDKDLPTLTN